MPRSRTMPIVEVPTEDGSPRIYAVHARPNIPVALSQNLSAPELSEKDDDNECRGEEKEVPNNMCSDADAEEEDTDHACAVCFSLRCRPARVSASCAHTFCRMCVFRLASTAESNKSGCPMCRAARLTQLSSVLLPSDIPFDATADAVIAAASPAEHREAVRAEESVEARLSVKLLTNLPLVMHPGSCPTDGKKTLILRVNPRTKLTLIFSDTAAVRTISHAAASKGDQPPLGVIFRDGTATPAGFVARTVRPMRSRDGNLRVALSGLTKCAVLGEIRHDAEGGMTGHVELADNEFDEPMAAHSCFF